MENKRLASEEIKDIIERLPISMNMLAGNKEAADKAKEKFEKEEVKKV